MSLNHISEAIAASIKGVLPALKTCEVHPGRFDEKELRRVAAKAPAVFVALLSAGGLEGIEVQANTQWAAFVVTRDSVNGSRAQQAIGITQAIACHLHDNDLGLSDAISDCENISARNLYSASIDKTGTAMWVVTWQQALHIGSTVIASDVNDFLTACGQAQDGQGNTLINSKQTLGANP